MEFASDYLRFKKAFEETWEEKDSISVNYHEIEVEQAYLIYYLMRSYNHNRFCQLGSGHGKVVKAIFAVAGPSMMLMDVDKRYYDRTVHKASTIHYANDKNNNSREKGCRMETIEAAPAEAFGLVTGNYGQCDFLYINDDKNLPGHISLYAEYFLTDGGYLAINKEAAPENVAYAEKISQNKAYQAVFEEENFIIYKKSNRNVLHDNFVSHIREKLQCIMKRLRGYTNAENRQPTVGLGIITYNHGKYIRQCMEGVFAQEGDFKLNVVIVNDHSPDDSKSLIDGYIEEHKDELQQRNIDVKVIHNATNMGATEAIALLVRNLEGNDYFSYIEGDDYWRDPHRTQNHIKTLAENPECVFSVNSFVWYYEAKHKFVEEKVFSRLSKRYQTSFDILEKYIGNIGCYFFAGHLIKGMDYEKWKRMKIEWATITMFSCQGDGAYIDEAYNVYRKHEGGTWSTLSNGDKSKNLLKNIDAMNRETQYLFDYSIVNMWIAIMMDSYRMFKLKYDMVAIDTLEHHVNQQYDDIYHLVNSYSLSACYYPQNQYTYSLSEKEPRPVIARLNEMKKLHPEMGTAFLPLTIWSNQSAKILYLPTLNTGFSALHIAEYYKMPFVVHLSQDDLGGCIEKDQELVNRVSRMLQSPMFKVALTSDFSTYRYLSENAKVPVEKIRFIPFGSSHTHTEGLCKRKPTEKKAGKKICIYVDAYSVETSGGKRFYKAVFDAVTKLMKNHNQLCACILVQNKAKLDFIRLNSEEILLYKIEDINKNDFYRDLDAFIAYDLVQAGDEEGVYPALEACAGGALLLCPDKYGIMEPHLYEGVDFCKIDEESAEETLVQVFENPEQWERIALSGMRAVSKLANPKSRAEIKKVLLDEVVQSIDYDQLEEMDIEKIPLWDQFQIQPMPPKRSTVFKACAKLYHRFCPAFIRPLAVRIKTRLFDKPVTD